MTSNFDITKGKYSLNRVSANPVFHQDVIKTGNKDNAKLQKMFNAFDVDRDEVISTEEQVEFVKFFKTFDTNKDGQLSTAEFDAYVDGNVIRDFFQKVMNAMNQSESVPLAEAEAFANQYKSALPEDTVAVNKKITNSKNTSESEAAETQKKQDSAAKIDSTGTGTIEIQDSVQKPVPERSEADNNQTLHKYVVQMDESFTQIIKKSLKAQGIEKPTPEQIKEAKEQFKLDNPKAIKTNRKGYEFLLVGAEVKLRGNVSYAKDSDATIADWCKKYPHLVLYPQAKSSTGKTAQAAKSKSIKPTKPAKSQDERKSEIQKNLENITPDLSPKMEIDEKLQKTADSITEAQKIAPDFKKSLDDILTHDIVGADSARISMSRINKYNVAYIVDDTTANRIDNVLGLNKNDVKKRILAPMVERAGEVGAISEEEKEVINGKLSLDDMQGWINTLSERIKSADSAIKKEAAENKSAVQQEQTALKLINDNKELFANSLQSLVRMVDMAENQQDEVKKSNENLQNAVLQDGTEIFIKRDDSGEIIAVAIKNSNSTQKTDVVFADGQAAFQTVNDKEPIIINGTMFNFAEIKALAERIFVK